MPFGILWVVLPLFGGMPPYPYPTSWWTRPIRPSKKAYILGQSPQPYSASASPALTNIIVVMYIISLTPPNNMWYMDIRALSHSMHHKVINHLFLIWQYLHKNKFVTCQHLNLNTICDSYVFGKHVKLPFISSNNVTLMPFDTLHSNLWISHVLSSSNSPHYVYFWIMDLIYYGHFI